MSAWSEAITLGKRFGLFSAEKATEAAERLRAARDEEVHAGRVAEWLGISEASVQGLLSIASAGDASGVPASDVETLIAGTTGTRRSTAGGQVIPNRLGPYELIEEIGRGGMGVVYRARHTQLGTVCAVKVLLVSDQAIPAEIARFRREAGAVAKMGKHPNIVAVFDLGDQGGLTYYAMELVEGKSLRKALAEREYTAKETARLAEKVARALHYAHERGVIHRDVKPDNILMRSVPKPGEAEPEVTDFGLARDIATDTRLSIAGQIMGTLAYMAPEQARGDVDATDARTDVYALGGVIYEMLTGIAPHPGHQVHLVVPRILQGEIIPAGLIGADVPKDLETICMKCLSTEPSGRYATAGELADELARFQRGEPILARPLGPVARLARRIRRNPIVYGLSAALVVAALTTAWLGWRSAAESSAQARSARVGEFLTRVAQRSHRIDSHCLGFQESLDGLAAAATLSLTRGEPANETIYLASDFDSTDRRPPDLAASKRYGLPVSVDWPAWTPAPGVAMEKIKPKLERLSPLRLYCRRMFLSHREAGVPEPTDEEGERKLLLDHGVSIAWCYFGLVDGVGFLYPGHGDILPTYDPRVRPWYTLSAGKKGKRWGNPYPDATDRRLYLPCTMSMYDDEGTFLGVAGVEMSFDYVIDTLLVLPEAPVLRASLVDNERRVIVDTTERDRKVLFDRFDKGLPLAPYAIPEVAARMRTDGSGHLETEREGRKVLVAWFRLEDLDWYYVVEADLDRVIEGK